MLMCATLIPLLQW